MNAILPDTEALDITLLEEGFSNRVYRINWHCAPRLVVRLPSLNETVFGIDRETEIKVWRMAAENGLSSDVCWHNDEGVVASRFIAGETYSWTVKHCAASLASICESVKCLHQLPPIEWRYDVFRLMNGWLDYIHGHRNFVQVQEAWLQVHRFYKELIVPDEPKLLVLAHNDLNPKNMLAQRDKTWLIDWESAGMNDPLFDMAVLVHAHHLDAAQQQRCAQILFNRELSASDYESLEAYRRAYVVRELIWLLVKHLETPQDLTSLQWYYCLLSDPVFNPYFKTES